MGALGGPKSRPKGVRTAKSGLGQGRRRGQDSNFEVFWATLLQMSLFLEMYENIRKSMVFPGLERVQAPKLEPLGPKSRGVRTAKMTSNRAAGGVRIFIFRSSGRLYCKSCYFLK